MSDKILKTLNGYTIYDEEARTRITSIEKDYASTDYVDEAVSQPVNALADGKVDKNQGTENNGKFLGVVDGYLVLVDAPSGTSGTTDVVRCVAQELTEEQQEQVRANIGAASMTEFSALSEEITESLTEKEASGTADSKVSEHNTSETSHSDIRLLIEGLTTRLNALADSDDTTLDQMSEVVAYIKSNKTLIEAITTNKVSVSDIVDNLTTSASNKPLSAKQGVALKALIDAIVVPKKTSQLTNDSGFLTEHQDISGLAPKATTLSGYGITDGATKEQFNQLSEQIADLQTSLEPMDGDIPKVFLTGDEFSDMTTDKNEVNMEMEYRSRTKQFHAYILIKFQGRSSLSKPKKNFTIKMYSDDTRESKLKMAFKDWGFEKHKYVLKANFIDHTHARNIIGANLWSEVVASRSDYDTLPEELRTSPRNGAIDGFPIKLYVNGTYQGIYTWNIGKDDWMWGMDEDNPNHVLLCAENNTDGVYGENACNFRKIWNGVDGTRYSIEVGTNSDSLVTSVNNLITFVMSNNGDSFKTGIGNYLDVQSAIDYYIHQYVICGLDGLAQNMLLGTYDGVIWRCGAYDMDSTFGLWWTGAKFVSTDYKCPEDYQEKFSLLWERFEENFWSEIQTRYSELRKTVYSVSNMFTVCERFTDIIGSELYVEDLEVYPDIPQGSTSNIKQLRNFIRDRLAYCDEQILNGIPAVSITLNKTSLTLDGRAETLTATVLPSDTTDDILWITSDSSVATVNNGVVTPVSTGTCTIRAKCGSGWAICEVTASITTEPDEPDEPEVSYTNLVPTSIDTDGSIYNGIGYKDNCRLSSSGAVKAQESASVTGFMPYTHGSIVRAKTKGNGTLSGSSDYFQIYNEDFTLLNSNTLNSFNNTSYGSYVVNEDGSDLITINTSTLTSAQGGKWCRFSRHACKGADIIITANEEIV